MKKVGIIFLVAENAFPHHNLQYYGKIIPKIWIFEIQAPSQGMHPGGM
jgi:hypothetical protein